MLFDYTSEIIGGDMGWLRSESGDKGVSLSSKMELKKKREPERVALSLGQTAVVSLEWKREENVDQQKLFEVFLAKDQEDLSI